MKEQKIGYVSKFFGQILVAAIEITSGELHVGDKIRIVGHTTDLKMAIESMQIEHASVESAVKGDSIGLKVSDKARRNDKVVKLVD